VSCSPTIREANSCGTTEDCGHVLVLEPSARLLSKGYPPRLGIQVNGYGQQSNERRIARRLGIPPCEWTFEATADFVDVFAGEDVDPGIQHFYDVQSVSADGRSGYTTWFGTGGEPFGVLLEVDLDRLPDEAFDGSDVGSENDDELQATAGSPPSNELGRDVLSTVAVIEWDFVRSDGS